MNKSQFNTCCVFLAIDELALSLKRNLCCYLSQPSVRCEPLLTPALGNKRVGNGLGRGSMF
jgi:hypothetical protein